jgi:hypothetical protein
MTEPEEPQRETDACAMIARCHKGQYPHEYGRPVFAAVWTAEEAIELAPMIVDQGPQGGEG